MSQDVLVGLDVGGTKIHAAAFNRDLQPVAEIRRDSLVGGVKPVTESILSTLGSLKDKLSGVQITSIGVGIPGVVEVESGIVRQAVNLGITDQPLKLGAEIQAYSSLPCHVENDVNAVTLGAFASMSRTTPSTSLAFLNIGTGIAAGVVLNNRLHRGSRGAAGEVGHIPMANGPRCECGLLGCLEAVSSGAAIARMWPNGNSSAAVELFNAAEEGDPMAQVMAIKLGDHLARAIHLLALTFDVELLVIGGGVREAGQPFLTQVKAGITRLEDQSSFVRSLGLTSRVHLSPDGPIGALGAALLAAEATE